MLNFRRCRNICHARIRLSSWQVLGYYKNFVMIFAYNFDSMNVFLKGILQRNLPSGAWIWLEQERSSAARGDTSKFNIAFVTMPRRTGKKTLEISEREAEALKSQRTDLTVMGWSVDRLARVWLLTQLDTRDKGQYQATIENLFLNAEMSELVALYSSLPLLAYPELWTKRCAEGIRSNISQVLEAIICNNPFPAEHLDEPAWNQLVLKALFTEKPVLDIIGLRERRNANLANSLSDYAHERWAAHREVNPLLWICVPPFLGDHNFPDIQKLFLKGSAAEQKAAALVCHESNYAPAKRLLEESNMMDDIESGRISWRQIALL